eukprot:351511_1
MDSDTTMDSNSSKFEHLTCITVYPVLIKRIVSHCDINRLLNEYIFKGENAHHEKYMVRTSGKIENGQFAIYFTNKVSAETIYETMKPESIFACGIPRKQFLTSPNKDQFIPQTMRSWKWKKEINLHINDFKEYSFTNCYQIEHAIENKHEAVVLTINHDENQDVNNTKTWHLIIFSSEFAQKDRNIQNICKTDQIEIVSEICYQGMVTNIDSSKNGGYVRNKKWHATHQFIIDKQYESKIIPESHYVSLEPIKSDGIAQNIDIVSKTTLCSRREIPDQLSNFNGSLIKLTSTETSPIMFISPKRRNRKYAFSTNEAPKRRHSVASTHSYCKESSSHKRAKSRFIVNDIGQAYDTEIYEDIHNMLLSCNAKSTPYRVQHNPPPAFLQPRSNSNLRDISREVSINNSNSPSSSFHTTTPLTPLSECGYNDRIRNITPSESLHKVNERIENSESRKKSERLWLFDMTSWNDNVFKEFLTLIGETTFIHLFDKNAIEANHLLVADESMLRSIGLPPIHIKNIVKERDYYKNSDRILRSLAKLNVKKEMVYKLENLLSDLKDIMNDSRIKILRLQKLKCRKFAQIHHDIVQIIKEYVEIIENEIERKNNKKTVKNVCDKEEEDIQLE